MTKRTRKHEVKETGKIPYKYRIGIKRASVERKYKGNNTRIKEYKRRQRTQAKETVKRRTVLGKHKKTTKREGGRKEKNT